MFLKYPKIHRLGSEENDGVLIGTCYVQEKIDGANTSIWLEDGKLCGGSRNRKLGDESFNGFVGYINTHEGIQKCLRENPTYRLFGEWLVRHTIVYRETVYKCFYLFDVMVDGKFLPIEEVYKIAEKYGITTAHLFGKFENPAAEDLYKLVGQTMLGDTGEGIVIKNTGFINAFGDAAYAKIVTDGFKEDNAIVFGGNNKFMPGYNEMYLVNKYITLPRVQKVMQKIQPTLNRKLAIQDTARIINTVYHDFLTEEIWAIQKKVREINFKRLQGFACKKAARIYHDILRDHVSVAYTHNQNEPNRKTEGLDTK